MAKSKNVTQEQVAECMMNAENASEAALEIIDAIRSCKIDDQPQAYRHAKMLMACSRELSALAVAMLSQHELQEQRKTLAGTI